MVNKKYGYDTFALALRVCTAIDEGVRSIVLIHGTDTMEDSAWLTDLLLGQLRREACSVVFTGAMRFSDDNSADGPDNLVVRFWSQNRTDYR